MASRRISLRHQALARVIPVARRVREARGRAGVERQRRDLLEAQRRADPSPPRSVARSFDVRHGESAGMPVHELTPRGSAPQRSVVYLHGGGFVAGLDRRHWAYAARLAERLGVRVVLPSYPLTPTHTWRDATPRVADLVEQVAIDSPHGVVLAGDSAGGGLALGVAQQLARRSGPQPTELVLISPWLDLTGETPGTREASLDDPWLTLPTLRLYGAWWGAGDPPEPEASPLSNDLAGLPPTLVLCGARDLLVPQARALVTRAEQAGTEVTYVEEPGLLHVYPILPVPEARRAMRQVEQFLLRR